ncbi:Hypothetical protein, putative [Bodo saltans]|uniref:SET domain-containing protein n=1 Tax=Bodo saltans TaxID=75058 RepID=A0A0S4KGC3_BODSA|nr:Hypothetical protein, putative [Bodo saltans]|eukprot:CUI14661.1 Hypothetical protein, putative [Bodo saltans]
MISICRLRVDDGGPERGNIAVASETILGEGTCVLVEDPQVFSPSLWTISTPEGKCLGKQCWACGALLITIQEDWDRCVAMKLIGDGDDVPTNVVPSVMAEGAPPRRHRTVAIGHNRVIYLCDDPPGSSTSDHTVPDDCSSIAWRELGLQHIADGNDDADLHDGESQWNGVPPVHLMAAADASTTASAVASHHPLPVTRRDAVEALWCVAESLNERVWVMTRWVCRLLCQWDVDPLPPSSLVTSSPRISFDQFVGNALDSFAEGAPQPLNPQRRGVLRYVTAVLNVLLSCRAAQQPSHQASSPNDTTITSAAPPLSSSSTQCFVTIQTILRMVWVLDANSHTFVVLCPLYTWYQQQHCDGGVVVSGDEGTGDEKCGESTHANDDLRRYLEGFFERTDHNLLHSSGVALYSIGSKFNHSCTPNVRFLPSPRNRVEALAVLCTSQGVVERGEELFISYVDLDSKLMQRTAERRDELLRHYGFHCLCSRCTGR